MYVEYCGALVSLLAVEGAIKCVLLTISFINQYKNGCEKLNFA